jgi:hypothetical protein
LESARSFPNDEAALTRLFLAIRNAGLRWRRAIEMESHDRAIYGRVRRAPLCFSSEPANRIRHARLTETSLPRIRLRPVISCRKPTPVRLALRSSIDLCFLCYRLEGAEQNPSIARNPRRGGRYSRRDPNHIRSVKDARTSAVRTSCADDLELCR